MFATVKFDVKYSNHALTVKRLGWGQIDSRSGFSKNIFFRDKVKPYFVVRFNIIRSHIFPESFIKTPQVFQKI